MKQTIRERSFWQESVAVRVLVITLSAFLYALNFKSFVAAGNLFPGGFAGMTRLIQRVAAVYLDVELPFSPINLMFNAIPAIISFKLIGKKFTLYSCLSIVLTSFFTDLIPSIDITEDILLVCVFGGMINGFSLSLCLLVRATSGGTDFIAIALSERKNIDAWNYILCGNVVMLVVAGLLFGWDTALYSIIFQFTSTQIIRLMDPDGRRSTLFIVTGRESAAGVCAVIQDTHHTATLIEGVGLYNGEPCVMVYSVVENSRVRVMAQKIHQTDPKAFVNVVPTDRVVGRFYRRPRD